MLKKKLCIVLGIVLVVSLSACNENNVKQYDKETSLNVWDGEEYKDNSNIELDNKKEDADELSNIVLYRGYEINTKPGCQWTTDMKVNDDSISSFNTTYYNYENGKYGGDSKGTFGEETYEGVSMVSGVGKIAMTKKFDAVPRNYAKLETLPNELNELMDCSRYEIHSIDLDGDKKQEYIVSYVADYKAGDIGDGEPIASSAIMLLDSNYSKIADLVSLENGFWANIKSEENKIFLSLEDVEYIDLDEDGIMEIIIEVPTYEGLKVSILKYSNGKIEGEINVQASVLP